MTMNMHRSHPVPLPSARSPSGKVRQNLIEQAKAMRTDAEAAPTGPEDYVSFRRRCHRYFSIFMAEVRFPTLTAPPRA